MPICAVHGIDALASRSAADFDMVAVEAVFNLPPAVQSVAAFTAVAAMVTERLLKLLGGSDAEAIGNALLHSQQGSLRSSFLNLGHAALLALLKSDQLKARSENSVLMIADAWVWGPRGKGCSKVETQQVAHALRLGHLSKIFVFDVLSQMEWLEVGDTGRVSLLSFIQECPIGQEILRVGNHLFGPHPHGIALHAVRR